MDWLQRMNHAIDYIEDNLENNIDYEQIARIALCSVYQFQRMFSFVLEIPLSEYIRRRRLTLAAFDLKNRNNKVIDIALKYGYETPESFSRAFHNLHGLTPTSTTILRTNKEYLSRRFGKTFARMASLTVYASR